MAAKGGGKEKVQVVDISSSSSMKKRKSMAETTSTPVPVKIKKEAIGEDDLSDLDDDLDVKPAVAKNNGESSSGSKKVVIEHKTKEEPAAAAAALGGVFGSGDEWPFEGLCEQLCLDLFAANWEIRHGAAIGLREVLKVHGSGAGKLVGQTREKNNGSHRRWLEDVAIRLLCVLALDRFADFVSDQVVVPVRETCAQTLGVVLQWCDRETCLKVVEKGLLRLIERSGSDQGMARGSGQWEVRHAGLIGLKYWMAVRKDLVGEVLVPTKGFASGEDTGVFRAIVDGLKDADDDVRAVSSSTVLPIASLVVSLLPPHKILQDIVYTLWDCLQELDDLTSATASVMDLLSRLVMDPVVAQAMREDCGPGATGVHGGLGLKGLVPRLYPFFRHAIVSVRVAVLKTVRTLVDVATMNAAATNENDGGSAGAVTDYSWVTAELLRLVFQNFLLEEKPEIVEASLEVWTALITFLEKGDAAGTGATATIAGAALRHVATPHLSGWFGLLMTPVGTPLDSRLFFHHQHSGGSMYSSPAVSSAPSAASSAAASPVAGKKKGRGGGRGGSKAARGGSSPDAPSVSTSTGAFGEGLNVSVHDKAMANQDLTVVSVDDVIRGRVAAATALGRLICCCLSGAKVPAAVQEVLNSARTGTSIAGAVANMMVDAETEARVRDLVAMHLASGWAGHRVFAHVVVEEWAVWFSDMVVKEQQRLISSGAIPPQFVVSYPFVATSPLINALCEAMVQALSDADSGASLLYNELINPLTFLHTETQGLLGMFVQFGIQSVPILPPLPQQQQQQHHLPPNPLGPVFTLQVAERILAEVCPQLMPHVPPGPAGVPPASSSSKRGRATSGAGTPDRHTVLIDWQRRVQSAIDSFRDTQSKTEVRVLGACGSAVVAFGRVPAKMNPVIRALMNGIKSEANEVMQRRCARGLGGLISLLIEAGGGATGGAAGNRSKAVVDKVVKNLAGFLCSDPDVGVDVAGCSDVEGILSINKKNEKGKEVSNHSNGANGSTSDSNAAGAGKARKRKSTTDTPAGSGVAAALSSPDVAGAGVLTTAAQIAQAEEAAKKAKKITRRGAEMSLQELCRRFGPRVLEVCGKLWELMATPLKDFEFADGDAEHTATNGSPIMAETGVRDPPGCEKVKTDHTYAQEVVDSLQMISTVSPSMDRSLHVSLKSLLPSISRTLRSPLAIVRSAGARCIACLCNVTTSPAMQALIDYVLPLLGDSTSVIRRQGAAECVYHVTQRLNEQILPYIIFLIVPVLGRMSDPDEGVRFLSTNVFADLVKLVPLESGVPDPEGIPEELVKQRREERKFIGQLVGSEKVEEFELPVAIKAELRPYQKEGVSWLAFLKRYQLHGILCDDMGLGKTLQSICILASDHHLRAEQYMQTKAPQYAHTPSLVVCPPTLCQHWYHEIKNYAEFMRPIVYIGQPSERARIRDQIPKHDVVITSYDILRNDIDEVGKWNWNYCILDEGHVIKNAKTKLTKAVKSVRAMKRLILSGTPIQNNVLELWSLFDFLMPGFLGTERQFNERFGKPILASRDAKSSSREQEQGALALEALHRQVLPFLLRRMKEDVLNDLPPKIIQDYECDLSEVQLMLYEEFAKSHSKSLAENELSGGRPDESSSKAPAKKGQHVFQALQYLRKLCNHPLLVLNEQHPQYNAVMQRVKSDGTTLGDLRYAPKILALKQLLLDCGIGSETQENSPATAASAVAPHRALIFCQLKTMIDIIETDLFKKHMPGVTYMRLDGTVDNTKRHEIVTKFNADPSIDVLLLTTHVGGLGLNLTGADTVIFVEHDWNPMKDLQAMDRAHRIGQKRVVNVYRLITRGTLEEKIMGLQKFKLNIASSIINQENAGLRSMDTDQILDLFQVGAETATTTSKKQKAVASASSGGAEGSGKMSAKEVLEGLEGLWDEKQYEDLGVDEFLKGLQ
ncbi:TATA-binding protein-associated factor mot1 [Quaeritorhiza haematococci]|nr:TATA-binding protein-associated factor mot1 [Quaeritorhiza haematococci]